jgi:hypothetical protein
VDHVLDAAAEVVDAAVHAAAPVVDAIIDTATAVLAGPPIPPELRGAPA